MVESEKQSTTYSVSYHAFLFLCVCVGGLVIYLQHELKAAPTAVLVILAVYLPVLLAAGGFVIFRLARYATKNAQSTENQKKQRRFTPTTRRLIEISVVFYAGLILTLLLTNPAVEDNGFTFLTAAFPLIILAVLTFVDRAPLIRAKAGGFELELHRLTDPVPTETIDASDLPDEEIEDISNNGQTIDEIGLSRREESFVDLDMEEEQTQRVDRLVEQAKAKPSLAPVLRIVLSSNRNTSLLSLRNTIARYSESLPIDYVVFIDRDERYLGFVSTREFLARYPLLDRKLYFGVDEEEFPKLLDRVQGKLNRFKINPTQATAGQQYIPTNAREIINIFERVVNLLTTVQATLNDKRIYAEIRREVRDIDIRPLMSRHVLPSNLSSYGISDAYLRADLKLVEIYQEIVKRNLTGIPIVSDEHKFITVVDIPKIASELIGALQAQQRKQ